MRTPSPPLESMFQALREVARTTARRLGKDVRLRFAGDAPGLAGREFSRIREALVQILRNAIDHGIESPENREKSGKPTSGEITIAFASAGDEIVVRVRDDGAGVDHAAIARRAFDLGLVETFRELPPNEALALLFEPGFSTREVANEVSGRGIGLDLVRENVEALDGKAEIDTTRGEGTTIILRIPRKSVSKAA